MRRVELEIGERLNNLLLFWTFVFIVLIIVGVIR